MNATVTTPRVAAPLAAPPPGFAGAGMALGNSGTMRLTAVHFAAAMVFLVAGAVGLVWIAPLLAHGGFLDARVAGVTHLFTLGWLTTTIFGALYQLLPVALGTPIRSVRAGYLSFAFHVPGVALFSYGVATNHGGFRHAGIALVIPAILIGMTNVAASLRRANQRDVSWWAVTLAIAALFATIVLGTLLVHNLEHGTLGTSRFRVLAIHLHLALAGWALGPMIGISRRLLPMFLLSHGVTETWSRRALALVAIALPVLTAGLAANQPFAIRIGALLLAAGIAAFLTQARLFYAARVRRRLDAGLRLAATSLVFLGIAAALGMLTLSGAAPAPRVATAYGIVALLGGIVLFVVGFFHKIAPFLAWIARYRDRMGREQVPAIADLYSARIANVQWVIMALAVTILAAGALLGHSHCTRVAAVLFGAGVLLFAGQMLRVAPIGRGQT